MRRYLHIDLKNRAVSHVEVTGDDLARAGRHLIAKTLLEAGVATVDPLGPDNPLIFSAGPYAGTNLSNANRLSVGCKSPLTGGIKEANSGGTFAVALGQLALAGFTLHGCSDEWVVIRITKDGGIAFTSAEPYLGKGTFEVAEMLHELYGKKVSIAQCGPVGERLGLLGGISFSDREGRPARLAARGGVGAVMGSKKVKAIVVDMTKIPELHDRRKVMDLTKDYANKLAEQAPVQAMKERGTALVGDFTNYIGGMPVRNFSAGQLVDPKIQPLKVGGDFIRQQNMARGGNPSHACMPGCVIQCSNEYVDAEGKELVSPLEYETLGLLGTNCGLDDPDDIARLNHVCNDLGIDTIETGATIGVLMEAGQGAFGDVDFVARALADIGAGNDRGTLLAQGTARVGEHYKVRRVPVIKKQAISAYDPRVIEVTGVSMMTTAQGADHTTGNMPMMDTKDKTVEEVVIASIEAQINAAIADSLGLCVFGRSVTDTNRQLLADAINGCHGTDIDPAFFLDLGWETLRMEFEFNRAAGFSVDDDWLPQFFYNEPLPPTNKASRMKADEIDRTMNERLRVGK